VAAAAAAAEPGVAVAVRESAAVALAQAVVRAQVAALDRGEAHGPRRVAHLPFRVPGQVLRPTVPREAVTQIGKGVARASRSDNCLRLAHGPREVSTGPVSAMSLEIGRMLVNGPAQEILRVTGQISARSQEAG
jgi:hypothetical protein